MQVIHTTGEREPHPMRPCCGLTSRPILTQFGFLALMLPIFIYLPETAQYYAAKGDHDRGKAALKKVNGGIADYDIELEYAIIRNTIEEEVASHEEVDTGSNFSQIIKSYIACFKGPDLVCLSIGLLVHLNADHAETNPSSISSSYNATSNRSIIPQYLLFM